MKKTTLYLNLTVLLLTSFSRTSAQTTDSIVYITALRYFYDEIITPPSHCITISYVHAEPFLWGTFISTLDKGMVDNLVKNNGLRDNEYIPINEDDFATYLHQIFDGIPNIHIISKTEAEELSRKPTRRNDFWKRLFKKYPCSGGYLFLSHIGYNEDQTEAIFYLENLFHSLAGGGFLAICKLVDGKWCVEKIEAVMEA